VSTSNTAPLTNLEQQHKLAKDLIRAARTGDEAALARIRTVRSDAASPLRSLTLADAQLAIAREAGFDSWPRLVADFHERDVQAFCDAVREGHVQRAQQLLASAHVRKRVNDPMFDFGGRATHCAAKNERLLAVLLDAGADVNMKRLGERPVHRARSCRRRHGAVSSDAWREADAERGGTTWLVR